MAWMDLMEHVWYTNVVFGERWSWKTYYFVRLAYEAYKRWQIVISNIWLSFPHIRFTNTKSLVPILEEIAEYNFYETTPMIAPKNYLKAYWLKKKHWKPKEFFILFDEIGIHLNHRNWSRNFKDDFLHDLIMEPRKYWLTLIWICQEVDTVDIEFLKMCNHWFGVRKWGRSFWESVFIRWYYVRWWKLDLEHIVENEFYTHRNWHYFEKKYDLSNLSWWLYYTREIQWKGTKFARKTPNLFKKWDIYTPPAWSYEIVTDKNIERNFPTWEENIASVSDTLFLIKQPVSEKWTERSEENMGVEGVTPSYEVIPNESGKEIVRRIYKKKK